LSVSIKAHVAFDRMNHNNYDKINSRDPISLEYRLKNCESRGRIRCGGVISASLSPLGWQ